MAMPRFLSALPLFLVPWLTLSLSKAAEAPDAVWSLSKVAEGSDAVRCEIRTMAVSGGVQLEPVASASAPIAGTYEFVATSRADGSRSSTSQSGTFDLEVEEEQVLSSTTLGVSDGRSYEAHLTLRSDDQNVLCRDEYPSNQPTSIR